ncbi:MAG: TPM domain-containing protein, partial [Actinomycetia bacterium]|nr:TPM domain-containing protein [Actinomycetes bacterium]
MRRGLSFLLAVMLFALLLPVASASLLPASAVTAAPSTSSTTRPYIVDGANLLSASEAQSLNQYLANLSDAQQCDIVVVTVNSLGGQTAQNYADNYFDNNGYGRGSDRTGILLLVSMAERDWWISTTGRAYSQLTQDRFNTLQDAFLSDLSAGNYYQAFTSFGDAAASLMQMSAPGDVYYPDGSNPSTPPAPVTTGVIIQRFLIALLIGAVAGLLVAVIVTQILKSRNKSVQFQTSAGSYLLAVPGPTGQPTAQALLLNAQNDTFLYQTVVLIPHPKPTVSDSGPSSSGGFG